MSLGGDIPADTCRIIEGNDSTIGAFAKSFYPNGLNSIVDESVNMADSPKADEAGAASTFSREDIQIPVAHEGLSRKMREDPDILSGSRQTSHR